MGTRVISSSIYYILFSAHGFCAYQVSQKLVDERCFCVHYITGKKRESLWQR